MFPFRRFPYTVFEYLRNTAFVCSLIHSLAVLGTEPKNMYAGRHSATHLLPQPTILRYASDPLTAKALNNGGHGCSVEDMLLNSTRVCGMKMRAWVVSGQMGNAALQNENLRIWARWNSLLAEEVAVQSRARWWLICLFIYCLEFKYKHSS